MIQSYKTDVGRELFEGNWSVFASRHALEPLEDCFIDLRILDAAGTREDVEIAFRGRLTRTGEGASEWTYAVSEPAACPFKYRIDFIWRGENVEGVQVTLSPNERA